MATACQQMTNEELLSEFYLSRSADSFNTLIERLRPTMLAKASERLKPCDAEDAVQEACIDIYNSNPPEHPIRNASEWVKNIVRARAVDEVRLDRKGIRKSSVSLEEINESLQSEFAGELDDACFDDAALVDDLASTPDATAIVSEDTRRMQQHLAALPENQREAVELYYGIGLTRYEIGSLLGVSPATIQTRSLRGIQTLRQAMAEDALTLGA